MPALQRGQHYLNIQVCNGKNCFYLFSVPAAKCADEQKNRDTGQKYRLQKVLSLTVNIKHGKAAAALKEGLKRKRKQDTPGDTTESPRLEKTPVTLLNTV